MTYAGWPAREKLSKDAQVILDQIGNGKCLRIPKDNGNIELKDPPNRPKSFGQVSVNKDTVNELLQSKLLRPLTKFTNNNILGWSELGFTDGDIADYLVCVQ